MKTRSLMIIHNFPPGPVGGAELQAERLAVRLVHLGHGVGVVTRQTVPDAPLEEERAGVWIRRLPHPLPYWVRGDHGPTFRFLVRNLGRFDLLHSHMAFGHAVVAIVVARSFRKKAILKIACAGEYGDLHLFSQFDRFDQALSVLHQADSVVAVSSEVERELHRYGFPAERVMRIPNGVDSQYFKRQEKRIRIERFVLVGRRHPQKGVDTVLLAARRLKEMGLGGRFVVSLFGDDYPEYDYRALASELGVTDVVEFGPFEKDVRRVYESADCLLLPSRGEGLSNALLEAMAMELPVIATAVSGTPDVVEDGRDGLLIPPDAPEALVAAMTALLESPELGNRLGLEARKKVVSRFSLDVVAQRYSDLYQHLSHGRTDS
jgi:glycosyltransferase involved in cell wall biosynthesis